MIGTTIILDGEPCEVLSWALDGDYCIVQVQRSIGVREIFYGSLVETLTRESETRELAKHQFNRDVKYP